MSEPLGDIGGGRLCSFGWPPPSIPFWFDDYRGRESRIEKAGGAHRPAGDVDHIAL
jgi:hypothetical protein